MRAVTSCLLAAVVLLLAAPAGAQDPERKVHFNFGGGYTATSGEVSNHLGGGYNINFGMTVQATPVVGFHAEYSYNGLGQKQVNVDVVQNPIVGAPTATQSFYGDMNMQYGAFSAVFTPRLENKIHPYLIAGLGIYYRPIKVTTPAVGYVPGYCDPFWYYCTPGGLVPVEKIVGERSSTDFGINFGGGVNFRLAETASFYVEARYHYIWGPKYDYNSTTYDSNSGFLPITFGIRF